MRIAIITDAWHPQVNGVVRTLEHTGKQLEAFGHQVLFITPQDFSTYPCPTYPDIRLALFPRKGVRRKLTAFLPNAIHIATEGPLGHAARKLCRQLALPFTTSFHTQFPEYIRARVPVPLSWSYRYLRAYHRRAVRTFVPTPSMQERLQTQGFQQVYVWSRGVDTNLFPSPTKIIPIESPADYAVSRPRRQSKRILRRS